MTIKRVEGDGTFVNIRSSSKILFSTHLVFNHKKRVNMQLALSVWQEGVICLSTVK